MKLIYTPEDGDRQEWDFDPRTLINVEAEMVENASDAWNSYTEALIKLMMGAVTARRAFLWMFLRRENPKLRFRDLAFRLPEVRVELGDDEEIPDFDAMEEQAAVEGKDGTGDSDTDSG